VALALIKPGLMTDLGSIGAVAIVLISQQAFRRAPVPATEAPGE
jgi:hypothetical protein